jgi:hypothetical protein
MFYVVIIIRNRAIFLVLFVCDVVCVFLRLFFKVCCVSSHNADCKSECFLSYFVIYPILYLPAQVNNFRARFLNAVSKLDVICFSSIDPKVY